MIALQNGMTAHGLQVRTSARLGHTNRTDHFTANHFWQPVLFLFF